MVFFILPKKYRRTIKMKKRLLVNFIWKKRDAGEIGNAIACNPDYEPKVLCEYICSLPDSFWHENRTKGWGAEAMKVL